MEDPPLINHELPDPGKHCLLPMVFAASLGHGWNIRMAQETGNDLTVDFVQNFATVTKDIRSEWTRHRRNMGTHPPATDFISGLCLAGGDQSLVIANGVFYYLHAMPCGDPALLRNKLALHGLSTAFLCAFDYLWSKHETVVVVKMRNVASGSADQIVGCRFQHHYTPPKKRVPYLFRFPFFANPSIGLYYNGDVVVTNASLNMNVAENSYATSMSYLDWLTSEYPKETP